MNNFEKWLAELLAPIPAEVWPDEIATEVTTPLGIVKGGAHKGIRIFRGIPYAKPPIGERRFAPPEKTQAWNGVKDCTRFGSMSYQVGQGDFSEDCLSLNVWTPAKSSQELLPVYVFIHGGGNTIGSGSQPLYESTNLAQAGVVVVTINYRLNALGFLPLATTYEKYGTTGNWAILDMICALEWVRDNIKAFGGNPSQVTIGGESVGSFAVSALISSPRAAGLFQQAIMESGALPMTKAAVPMTSASLSSAVIMGGRFAALFGAQDSPSGLDYLRTIPPQDIANASAFVAGDMRSLQTTSFWAIPDGNVIPENPVYEINRGNINKVKLLVGFNTHEGTAFIRPESTEGDYRLMVYRIFGKNAPAVLERYPITAENGAYSRMVQLTTLSLLRSGSYLYADALAKLGEDVFAYRFDFVDPALRNTGVGATHASEMKYIFHNFMEDINKDETAKAVAKQMYTAWTNFIKTGDPNQGVQLSQNIKWEKYSEKMRVEWRFAETSAMEPLYEADDIDFINKMMHESLS
jgi:para-nitrobenzyl esterase